MRLKDKVAIITGAAQGIGLACAERFVQDGAKVVLADVKRDVLQTAAAQFGASAVAWVGDLGATAGVAAMAEDLVQRAVGAFGRVDILVNNAGIIHNADALDFPEEAFDRVLRINLKAPLLLSQAVGRQMIRQGHGGAIINMSSINALLALPNSLAYAVSKGGVKQLTAVMGAALAQHGIRVNAIGPGTIMTDMVKTAVMTSDEARRTILSRTPIGRCGEPSEIASVAAFLASNDASYMVGQTIYPDGGRLVLNYTVPVKD